MEPISVERLQTDVETALGLWHEPSAAGSPLDYLACVRLGITSPLQARRAHNQVLLQALDQLAITKPESTQLLRMRFLEKSQISEVALRLNIVENTYYVRKPVAIRHLAEVLLEIEQVHRAERNRRVEQRLWAPTYQTLVGAESAIASVVTPLSQPTAPWLIMLSGMGGIGKTSLADHVVRQVLQAGLFGDIGWVSAQRDMFSLTGQLRRQSEQAVTVPTLIENLFRQVSVDAGALRQDLSPDEMVDRLQERFKAMPHLVVIDNLETLADVEPLLPLLRRFMNPTKFVLTSRQTLVGEPDLYHIPVTELAEADALQLVRQEAQARNVAAVVAATNNDLLPLYQVVGGNPLALRLLVGQLQIFDMDVVVANLLQGQGASIESLYTYIYRNLWEQLTEPARQVLLTMPLLPLQGGMLNRMIEVSRLAPGVVQAALHQLVQLNLVDIRGDLGTRRYTIHSLTRSFLQDEVAKW